MGMRQKDIFDLGCADRHISHLKIILSLFHAIIHKELTLVKPFNQRMASGNLMSGAEESDLHNSASLSYSDLQIYRSHSIMKPFRIPMIPPVRA